VPAFLARLQMPVAHTWHPSLKSHSAARGQAANIYEYTFDGGGTPRLILQPRIIESRSVPLDQGRKPVLVLLETIELAAADLLVHGWRRSFSHVVIAGND
jgi:hypothetical protein